jgi:hypothetical protein
MKTSRPLPSTPREEATASMRSVICPSLLEVTCPFCAKTDVSLFIGKVSFSATMGGDDLCNRETVTLAALICEKSHLFFVRESDMVSKLAARFAA